MSRVDIWVLGFEPGWSEPPSEGLRRVFGLEVQEALTLELTVPAPVKRVDAGEAEQWLSALRSIGAEVESRPAESGVPPAFDLDPPRGVPPTSDVKVFEGPPGIVMPAKSAQAKAKARAEVAALAGSTRKKPAPPKTGAGGAVKEEVVRVIRTPSTPQDRRPPPARKASQPAIIFDEDLDATEAPAAPPAAPAPPTAPAAADPFGGDLDIALPSPAKGPTAKSKAKSKSKSKSAGPSSAPLGNPGEAALSDAFEDPLAPDVQLELEDVREARPATDGPDSATHVAPVVEGANPGREIGFGLAFIVLGLVALYVGVMRFQSCLLGTGDYVTWLGDAVGFGGLVYGLYFVAAALTKREPELDPSHIGAAMVLGFGIAFGVATLQAPTEPGDGVDAREFVAEPKSRLVDSTSEQGREIVDAAFEGGAVSVEAGGIQSFLGRQVAHSLVIRLPESGGARAHMAALIRRSLGADRAILAANVPSGDVWVVPLRP